MSKNTIQDRSLERALNGMGPRQAIDKTIREAGSAQVARELTNILLDRINKRLRNNAIEEGTTEIGQLVLPILNQDLPSQVRVENEDKTIDWKPWYQLTEYQQLVDHYEWVIREQDKRLGVANRKFERLERSNLKEMWPDGEELGRLVYGDTACSICGGGYIATDPFERAHEDPIKYGGHDSAVTWAHASCNRMEAAS